MKITEKWLLDNLNGIANCGDLISQKEDVTCYWGYGAGYGNDYRRVSFRDDASSIHVEYVKGEFDDRKIFSIELPRFARNKAKNVEAQALIKKWEDKQLGR